MTFEIAMIALRQGVSVCRPEMRAAYIRPVIVGGKLVRLEVVCGSVANYWQATDTEICADDWRYPETP